MWQIRFKKKLMQREEKMWRLLLVALLDLKCWLEEDHGVKITISSIGNVETDLRSEFSAQGINQTLHRVYLQVKCNVNILTPFDNSSREITNQVLLMENVIVGNIPNTYYNLEGMDGNSDALEVIE